MLRETAAVVERGIAAHQTAAQLKQAKALARWDSWAHGFLTADQYLDILYKDLARPAR
jgi:hypothetical protein